MSKSTQPIPAGVHTVTPYLVVREAKKAIEFYKKAFGAVELFVLPGTNGKIMHAQIKIGDSNIMLTDENPEMDSLGPQSRGGPTSSLMVYVEDVDKAFDKAVNAGCTVLLPVSNQFWGDRYGIMIDPFGHKWAIATHVEDLSHEEIAKRGEEAMKQMAASKK